MPDIRPPDAITPDWLSAVLSEGGIDAEVRSFTATPVGTGQLGDSVRFVLDYARGETSAPRSLVGKFPAAAKESRSAGIMLGNYLREVRFYQQLAPSAGLTLPTCYFTDVNPESHLFVLMMADLAPAQQGDQLKGVSIAEARVVMEEAAKLHASHWNDDAMLGFEWLNSTDGTGPFLDVNQFSTLWEGFRERYGKRVTAEAVRIGEALCVNWDRFDHVDGPRGLNHADFRPDNMMFLETESGPLMTMLDWQSIGYGNPATDIGYFFGGTITREMRQDHGAMLLAHYHDTLLCNGVEDYGAENFDRHFARGGFQLFATAYFAAMLVTQTPRGDDMFFRMLNGAVDQIVDTDAEALLF